MVDNYATHKHEKVKRFLAARPRWHVHYTPTYASWFNIVTQQAIQRGSFRNVKELVGKIEKFVQAYNTKTKPFVWTATTISILENLQRLCQKVAGTGH